MASSIKRPWLKEGVITEIFIYRRLMEGRFSAAVTRQEKDQKELEVIRGNVLDEQDQQLAQDIDSGQVNHLAVMPGKKTAVNGRDHRRDKEQKECDPSLEQTFEEPDLDAEPVVGIPAEVMIHGLLPQEIGAEIFTLKPTAEDDVADIEVGEYFVIKKGARVLVVETLVMAERLEHFEPILQMGQELVDEKAGDADDDQLQRLPSFYEVHGYQQTEEQQDPQNDRPRFRYLAVYGAEYDQQDDEGPVLLSVYGEDRQR